MRNLEEVPGPLQIIREFLIENGFGSSVRQDITIIDISKNGKYLGIMFSIEDVDKFVYLMPSRANVETAVDLHDPNSLQVVKAFWERVYHLRRHDIKMGDERQ
jgi:hypothetical protein